MPSGSSQSLSSSVSKRVLRRMRCTGDSARELLLSSAGAPATLLPLCGGAVARGELLRRGEGPREAEATLSLLARRACARTSR